jgi:hypothetical protein
MKSPEPSEKTCVWITPGEAAVYLGVVSTSSTARALLAG